ncbi:hypothetical protein CDO52_19040 [Nocardiopsis gilva YIM 90087]|uniref:Uncharacterized protein n=1 Tax=Nocardiopsis gilva YIM 90087 TaxID=1235441 RepID=A0A223S907_9ACTN|nr:hypothetical protein [Nocardiopsis gilva]ASU84614.1 hypothetical protein CDO52_19040 [Nocardiopsis gilva YIM 90087]
MDFMRRFLAVLLVSVGSILMATGASADQGGGELDGFTIGYLPKGVGGEVADFDYEWGDVKFASRVWERQTAEGGYAVDLQVLVMRGGRLDSPDQLLDFLAEYHERDAATWELREFTNGRARGFISDAEAFWLPEPGVAVEVRADPARFGLEELRATALGIRRAYG